MIWDLIITAKAERVLEKLDTKDQRIIVATLTTMREDPFRGNIKRLHNERADFRRRVGNYRIFFDADPILFKVDVIDIARRTSTTY